MPKLKDFLVKLPRLFWCGLIAILALAILWLLAPQQLPLVLYKLAFVPLAGYAGYWLDRALFPYARPDGYLTRPWVWGPDGSTIDDADHGIAEGYILPFMCACLRRALIIIAAMLAMGLAL